MTTTANVIPSRIAPPRHRESLQSVEVAGMFVDPTSADALSGCRGGHRADPLAAFGAGARPQARELAAQDAACLAVAAVGAPVVELVRVARQVVQLLLPVGGAHVAVARGGHAAVARCLHGHARAEAPAVLVEVAALARLRADLHQSRARGARARRLLRERQ